MEEQLSLRYEKLSVLKIPTMIALKKICKTKLEYEKELDKVMKEYNDILISTKFSLRGVLDENYMSEECKKLVSYSNNSQRTYRDTFRRRQKEIQKLEMELKKSIEEQNFEKSIEIRDQLKKLK